MLWFLLFLPAVGAADTPLALKARAVKTAYPLDLGGKTADQFKAALRDAVAGKAAPPAAPAVDLVLELTNTSGKPVTAWTGGDPVELTMELKGPGAEAIAPRMAFTLDFRGPKGTEIAPGKAVELPVKSLGHGFRGSAKRAYWTAPGEYTLTVGLKTATKPLPPGAKDVGDGFGLLTLTAEPVKLTVEAK